MNRQKVVIATICTVAAISVLSVGVALCTGSEITIPFIGSIGSSQNANQGDGTTSYIQETSYDGTNPVDKEMFGIPFKKTDDYVQNKNLVKEDLKLVQDLEETATDFIEALLGTGYREVDTDGYSFKDTMSAYFWEPKNTCFVLDDGTEILISDYFEKFGEYISTRKIQADVSFKTDDSLVYADGYYYVRGKLTVTPYNFKESDDDEANIVPDGITYDKENTCIYEVSLKNMAPETDDYYVTGFYKLADFQGN